MVTAKHEVEDAINHVIHGDAGKEAQARFSERLPQGAESVDVSLWVGENISSNMAKHLIADAERNGSFGSREENIAELALDYMRDERNIGNLQSLANSTESRLNRGASAEMQR